MLNLDNQITFNIHRTAQRHNENNFCSTPLQNVLKLVFRLQYLGSCQSYDWKTFLDFLFSNFINILN